MKDSSRFDLPCGKCLGCNIAAAKDWALRCHHEFVLHDHTTFATPTYDDEHLPPTLSKRHLQLYLKKIRDRIARGSAPTPIRFFAAGEYGENTHRPHYHVLLFGASEEHYTIIREAWPHGAVRDIKPAVAESIAYTAGYCAKKYGEIISTQKERVDRRTGEVYQYQPPFIQMSRGGRGKDGEQRKGIGAHYRDTYTSSWESKAVIKGQTQRVPRYYHKKWQETATAQQQEKLENDKAALMKIITMTTEQRKAAETIAREKQQMKSAKRQAM